MKYASNSTFNNFQKKFIGTPINLRQIKSNKKEDKDDD